MPSPFQMFPRQELSLLRGELMREGIDCFQSAELLSMFINQWGYGVSHNDAREAASHIESIGFALSGMQAELERIAFSM